MPSLGIMASQITGHLSTDFDALATATVSSATATISFTSIPSIYTHLQIRMLARSVRTGSNEDSVQLAANSDTTASNYSTVYTRTTGAAGQSGTILSASGFTAVVGIIATSTAAAGNFGVGVIDILDYTSVNKNKTVRTFSGIDRNGADGYIGLNGNLWLNSSTAISSIAFTTTTGNNFDVGTKFALYGIK